MKKVHYSNDRNETRMIYVRKKIERRVGRRLVIRIWVLLSSVGSGVRV